MSRTAEREYVNCKHIPKIMRRSFRIRYRVASANTISLQVMARLRKFMLSACAIAPLIFNLRPAERVKSRKREKPSGGLEVESRR